MKIVRHNVGDKVIALTNPKNNRAQPRTKGQTYIVKAVMYCSECGVQMINIGVASALEVVECLCGNDTDNKGLRWTDSKHFAKPQELQTLIEEAVEIEDYETAHELHTLNGLD